MLETPEDLINHGDALIEIIKQDKELPTLEHVSLEYEKVDVEFDPTVEKKQMSYAKVFKVG